MVVGVGVDGVGAGVGLVSVEFASGLGSERGPPSVCCLGTDPGVAAIGVGLELVKLELAVPPCGTDVCAGADGGSTKVAEVVRLGLSWPLIRVFITGADSIPSSAAVVARLGQCWPLRRVGDAGANS